ncbi:hypothetical protein IWZ03DRAFT_130780 [Phyllosticta citriasiana]|uniref:Secreted protein n=1 Tax=Phyllosticta citriasiana TaxID=595635 RepID=A0ABR1KSX7_9PEZI
MRLFPRQAFATLWRVRHFPLSCVLVVTSQRIIVAQSHPQRATHGDPLTTFLAPPKGLEPFTEGPSSPLPKVQGGIPQFRVCCLRATVSLFALPG